MYNLLGSNIFAFDIVGKIFKFTNSELKNTQIPHYHICIYRENNVAYLVCCTSDRNGNRKRLAQIKGTLASLIHIIPDNENNFTIDTYVDCNYIFKFSIEELKKLIDQNENFYTGSCVNDIIIQKLYNGLLAHDDIVEEDKDILRTLIV